MWKYFPISTSEFYFIQEKSVFQVNTLEVLKYQLPRIRDKLLGVVTTFKKSNKLGKTLKAGAGKGRVASYHLGSIQFVQLAQKMLLVCLKVCVCVCAHVRVCVVSFVCVHI